MADSSLFNTLLIAVFVTAPIVWVSLSFTTAPYGRHTKKTPGPALPTKMAWVVMECPSMFAFGHFFFVGPHSHAMAPLILAAMWEAHYIHRTIIYPMQMRVGKNDTMPLAVVAMGFVFNLVNSYLNGTWVSTYGDYPAGWLTDPRFVVGIIVFATGYVINRRSDAILRNLRKPGETGYKIPQGGMYRWISCPNYFGELLTWTGWTIATWSLAGLSFAVFTAANLIPRALSNHRWYQRTFADYPAARRAVVPFLL